MAAAVVASVLAAGPAAIGADDTAQSRPTQSATTSAHDVRAASSAGMLAPRRGAWFGVSLDWSRDSLARYARRLGHRPAVAVTFSGFPMSREERGWVGQAVAQARDTGSMLMLTLEPREGLAQITTARAQSLARLLARYNRQGVPVFLRFAHEMNGSWYAWGQDPEAYVAAFRRLSSAVRAATSETAMMWAPNYGGGYPFLGGPHQAEPGSAAAQRLDTDGDGTLTAADDPYRPYWPGRQYVDWVGMTLYHWGSAYPWGENEIPETGKFLALLRGTYAGTAGDERIVPDFYAEYAVGQRLPLAITETAALYTPGRGGASELAIKRAWWKQVLAPGNTRRLPRLKMVNWFEWRKHEAEVGGVVDWSATRRKPIRTPFIRALPSWLRYAR